MLDTKDVLTEVPLERNPLDRLQPVLGDEFAAFEKRMHEAGRALGDRTIWTVNSTPEGGGVAEMLATLLPYAMDAGWKVRWMVISGDGDFFDVTKGIHNALHGEQPSEDIWEQAASVYAAVSERNAAAFREIVRPGDIALVHDPQPAGVVGPLRDAGVRVAWQCHVGTDGSNEHTSRAWDFLRSHVEPAERYVFTREEYLWDGLGRDRLRIIPPSIDALSVKNADLSAEDVEGILRSAGVLCGGDTQARFPRADGAEGRIEHRVVRAGEAGFVPDDARVVLQVSRWDRLKDPIGVLRMFSDHLADIPDLHLVYAGPSTEGVEDDPEGAEVLIACTEFWRELSPDLRERLHLLSVPMDDVEENAAIINALQRRADVIVQKSIEEGFGLTVAEALWKGRPVVAGRVGGIQDQIEDGVCGVLVDDPYDVAGYARAVRELLDDPERARRYGEAARACVQERFLGPRQLTQYAQLLCELAS